MASGLDLLFLFSLTAILVIDQVANAWLLIVTLAAMLPRIL